MHGTALTSQMRVSVSVGFEMAEVEPAPAVLVATKYSQDLGKGA